VHIFSFALRGSRDGIRKARTDAPRSRRPLLSHCRRFAFARCHPDEQRRQLDGQRSAIPSLIVAPPAGLSGSDGARAKKKARARRARALTEERCDQTFLQITYWLLPVSR
jgi:hypothetical protein